MSTFTTNTTSRPVTGSLFAALSGMLNTAVQYRQYRQTVRALSLLSSKELADLGLSHSTINSTAKEAVYGV